MNNKQKCMSLQALLQINELVRLQCHRMDCCTWILHVLLTRAGSLPAAPAQGKLPFNRTVGGRYRLRSEHSSAVHCIPKCRQISSCK
jgi:hypothetical protein